MKTVSRALTVVALAVTCLGTACAPAEDGDIPGSDAGEDAAVAPTSDAGQDAGDAPGEDASVDGEDAGDAPGEDASVDGEDAGDAPGADAGLLDEDEDAGPPGASGPGRGCFDDGDCSTLIEDVVFADSDGIRCVEGGCGCTSDSDCSAATRGPFCDVVTLGCAECLTSAECGGRRPVCSGGACAQCAAASDCVGSADGPYCDRSRCVTCVSASNCATSPDGRLCELGECRCDSSADCPSDRACNDGTCMPRCTSDATCVERGVSGQNTCDLTSGECVECGADAHCADAAYGSSCLPTQTCGCSADAHCATNQWGHWCDPSNSICGCTVNSDCPPEFWRCDRGSCGH